MSISLRSPYEEPESPTAPKWVILFILFSLLAHAIIIAAILLITVFMPVPKMAAPSPISPTVSLSLIPPAAAPTPKTVFIPTTPDPTAKHQQQVVESANDHSLTSKNQKARAPDSIMPDVTGREHAPNFNNTPLVEQKPKPQEVASTPPAPKQATPVKPTPPHPDPQKAELPKPQPPQPKSKPMPPTPPQKTPPQYDANGFPVLPPLNVPTMAPPNAASQPLAPVSSMRQQAVDSHGSIGASGDNSPAAMSSVLGKYRQKIYEAVGSNWYPKIDKSMQVIGVGTVHVQYTIHSDGSVETKVLDEGNGGMQILLSISVNSIREAAPFDKFDDYPGLREEIIKDQGGDGESFTSDFTFSAY